MNIPLLNSPTNAQRREWLKKLDSLDLMERRHHLGQQNVRELRALQIVAAGLTRELIDGMLARLDDLKEKYVRYTRGSS